MRIEINVLKRDGMTRTGGKFVYFKTIFVDKDGSRHWVNLKFTTNCIFENGVKVTKTGTIICEESDVQPPLTLETRIGSDGKTKYPCVLVKRVLDFKPFEVTKASQEMFGSFVNEQ